MLCLRAIHLESPSFCLRGNVASRRIWKTKHTQFNIKILLHQIFHLNSFHSTQLLQSVVSAGSACVCVLFQLRTDVHLLDLCHFWVVFPALPSESESGWVVSHSLWPHGLYSPWNSPGQNAGVGSLSLLQRTFPTQESNPDLSKWQADSLPAEPQRKPKNTGVSSLSLLQQIFPTQESNWDLLHCRQILYQLSYQGSSKPITKDRQ